MTGKKAWDVGCGTGRHSIELAKRGYAVTGLDLSSEMLARAAFSASAAGVNVDWIHADATQFILPGKYDCAICLCEGSFGLLGQGDDPIDQPLSILCNISRCLKPQAKVVLTVLNATAMVRKHTNEDIAEGRFDPLTLAESSECPPREGLPAIAVRERALYQRSFFYSFASQACQYSTCGAEPQGTGGEGISIWTRSRSWSWHAKLPNHRRREALNSPPSANSAEFDDVRIMYNLHTR